MTFGLGVTSHLHLFEILTFLLAATNLAPQILIPIAAPPTQRGFSFSIVLIGIILGVLLGHVIAGLIAQFLAWHIAYYISFGLHCVVLVCVFRFFCRSSHRTRPTKTQSTRHLLDNLGKYIGDAPYIFLLIPTNETKLCRSRLVNLQQIAIDVVYSQDSVA